MEILARCNERSKGCAPLMSYNFRFGALLPYTGEIARGVLLTLQLSLATMLLGLAIGLFVALGANSPHNAIRAAVRVHVEALRNAPLLVQVFIVFLGLLSLGIRLDANMAALIG